ncbi:hypothetical protein BDW22DRAFT_1314079, partial [Trametopsis cervina]
NPYSPFASKLEWELARWAKLRGVGQTAFSELLGIDGIRDKLGLTYKNSRELNRIIDSLPSSKPCFQRAEVVVGDCGYDFYFRDILACIKSLFGDPDFAAHLVFLPERHYADADRTVRLYHDMHTGKWWWDTQAALEKDKPGGTIIPVILSSDKTQLTLFRNKSAYPPSRHGQVLIGYLPAARFEHIKSPTQRRRIVANVFHACMKLLVTPLKPAGVHGVNLATGDGTIWRCHPIFSNYIGDYPEQVMVTLVKSGECPTCPVPATELSTGKILPPRDMNPVLEALRMIEVGFDEFAAACKSAGIKAVQHPFWEDLPYVNIYSSITPDILHQLYQGLIKHLVKWLKRAYGSTEIDARCRRMPPSHGTRLFQKGITGLQRVSGAEHADICRVLLGLVVDLRPTGGESPVRIVKAVRALLDFLYLARYPVHSTASLDALDRAWTAWHDNKSGFIDTNHNFPKAHNPGHYRYYIELYGTTDNYNTENTERLYIDLAKDAYKATNRKEEFAQMVVWLERREKIWQHDQHIRTQLSEPVNSPLIHHPHIITSKHPSVYSVSFDDLANDYGADDIINALVAFIAKLRHPTSTQRQLQ